MCLPCPYTLPALPDSSPRQDSSRLSPPGVAHEWGRGSQPCHAGWIWKAGALPSAWLSTHE